jgi:hypothetical protein
MQKDQGQFFMSWKKSRIQLINWKNYGLFALIILLFWILAIWRLDEIPGEWYGDISIEHEYVSSILKGEWPYQFNLSAGPVYHYVIAPVIFFTGRSYYGYKIASIYVATMGIILSFFLGYLVDKWKLGLYCMLITAISFRFLAQARIGSSPHMIVPILALGIVVCALQFKKTYLFRYVIIGSTLSNLGLFTYPAAFIFPLYIIVLFCADLVSNSRKKYLWAICIHIILTGLIGVVFINMIRQQPDNFTSGYIGEKIVGIANRPVGITINKIFHNYILTMEMFHIRGDTVFRINIPDRPHLDILSRLLFFGGFVYLWQKKKYGIFIYILISFIILPLPSISPELPVAEIPSSGRTLALFPFVYLLVAAGIYHCSELMNWKNKYLSNFIVLILFCGIGYINIYQYFVEYPKILPNSNSPYAKIIAKFIDSTPKNYMIYLTDCCWGEWGQPEPKSIEYSLVSKRSNMEYIQIDSCDQIVKHPSVVIMNPYDQYIMDTVKMCSQMSNINYFTDSYGQRVFSSVKFE